MPFNFEKYAADCGKLDASELQRQWHKYTREISAGATGTAVSALASPFTLGFSLITMSVYTTKIHNARKKREIIERRLNQLGVRHDTRVRDVVLPMALVGTTGVLTLGLPVDVDVATEAAIEYGVDVLAVNGAFVAVEEAAEMTAAQVTATDVAVTEVITEDLVAEVVAVEEMAVAEMAETVVTAQVLNLGVEQAHDDMGNGMGGKIHKILTTHGAEVDHSLWEVEGVQLSSWLIVLALLYLVLFLFLLHFLF